MAAVIEKSALVSEGFARLERRLPGAHLPWLKDVRRRAMERFAEQGFPTVKQEAWRFTPVDAIAKTNFSFPEPGDAGVNREQVRRLSFPGLERFQLVFVNGRFSAELSSAPSETRVKAGDIASFLTSHPMDLERQLGRHADSENNPFTALNTALFDGGAHIYVPRGVTVEAPIHLLFIAQADGIPVQIHPRVLVVVEPDARVEIVETYAGSAATWTNAVSEVIVGENARVDHYKLQREDLAAFHVSTTQVVQARASRFYSHAVLLGAAISRNNVNVRLEGDAAECHLNGLSMVSGRQISDTHTFIDHARPRGVSREYYKGILDEKAQAVFDGHIVVRAEAQKTDSSQTNKNLLLSDEARVNTKPELKIFANDVKCKHGATIGQINSEQLFYLQSRGIPKTQARNLLIYGFASEMIEQLELEPLKEGLRRLLFATFEGRAGV